MMTYYLTHKINFNFSFKRMLIYILQQYFYRYGSALTVKSTDCL